MSNERGDKSHSPLGSLKIVPVAEGHEHYPEEEFTANVDQAGGVVYVREDEWPKIRDELKNLPTRQ